MASKYLQKYQVPEGFYDILHEFTREVLRAQPEDIIEYAANYFEHKSQGREYYYESKYNIQKPTDKYDIDNQKQYNPTPHQNYAEQAKRVVQASNQRVEVGRSSSGHQSQHSQHEEQPQQQHHQRAPSGQNGGRPATQNSITSDKPGDTSKISQKSKKSDVSHPEEKKISKEFVGDLYNSALHKALNPASKEYEQEQGEEEQGEEQQNYEGYEEGGQYDQEQQYQGGEEEGEGQEQEQEQEGGEGEYYEGEEGQQFEGQEEQQILEGEEEQQQQEQEQEQEQVQQQEEQQQQQPPQREEVVLDGPLEEYEDVALKIQSAFRNKQAKLAAKK